MKILSRSPKDTKRLASRILERLKGESPKGRSAILGLSGELGSRKTTLTRGLGRALGIKEKIQSPTFVIMRIYPVSKTAYPWQRLVHIDVYRIEKLKDTAVLNLRAVFSHPENIVVVEWAEKMKKFLPPHTLWVELKHKGKTHRHIVISE